MEVINQIRDLDISGNKTRIAFNILLVLKGARPAYWLGEGARTAYSLEAYPNEIIKIVNKLGLYYHIYKPKKKSTIIIYKNKSLEKKIMKLYDTNSHIIMGEILGYTCPLELKEIPEKKYKYRVFVEYLVDGVEFSTERLIYANQADPLKFAKFKKVGDKVGMNVTQKIKRIPTSK